MIILLIWTAVLIGVLVIYFRQIYSKFKKYDVKYDTPIPLFGNMARLILRWDHMADGASKLYNKFPEERFVGKFEFLKEIIMIRDLELVKQVTIKDIEYFLDHRSYFSERQAFFARNVFSLKGQEWKDMRSALSPAFTSSKMRLMVPFIVEVGEQMIAILKKKIKDSKTDYIDIDCKDLTTRYANDVIASCAFGLKVDSLTDTNNEFYVRGKTTAIFTFRQIIMFFLVMSFPTITKIFNWDFMSQSTKDFFRNLIIGTIKEREQKNIIRPDMIHLLMEAKKGSLKHENNKSNDDTTGFATVQESAIGGKEVNRVWTDDDIIAQALMFFVAGFETSSSGMCFLLYELAVNPDIQDRLAKEIREQDAKNGGKFDFNSIQDMTYLDMVVSEMLRLWPPGPALDRVCTKDYNLGKPNKNAVKDFIIRKGAAIAIPVYSFHRDPHYFPNPEKFDPERFSEENKHKINPFAYMPFGIGPRNCIGSRFALCELKALTYQILLHFEISPSESTCIPAKLSTESFQMKLHGGDIFRFRLRA